MRNPSRGPQPDVRAELDELHERRYYLLDGLDMAIEDRNDMLIFDLEGEIEEVQDRIDNLEIYL